MKTAIVRSEDLGLNCWLPARFSGVRCDRVMQCSYPEKRTCKAIDAEISFLESQKQAVVSNVDDKLDILRNMKRG